MEEEITVVYRLTALRDHDPPRLQTAAERSKRNVHEKLKSHAAATQSAVTDDLEDKPGVEVRNEFWITNALVVTVDTTEADLEILVELPHVERIHENSRSRLFRRRQSRRLMAVHSRPTLDRRSTRAAVSQPKARSTYDFEQINVPDVREEDDNRGEGAAVAVLDTGVDVDSHPSLELIEGGWVEFDRNGNTVESEPHGRDGRSTRVTRTIVGNQTNENIHYGVAPEAELLHEKVLNDDGLGTFAATAAGMGWGAEHDADIDALAMSVGGEMYTDDLIDPF